MQPFHVVGKYLTERYGTNVKIVPANSNDAKFGIKGVTDFKVEINSRKLKSVYSATFSTVEKQGMKSFKQIVDELQSMEV